MQGLTFDAEDGPDIERLAKPMVKKPNPVYMLQIKYPFKVMTKEGPLEAPAGSYLAYDPLSKTVWPVDEEYVKMHYVPA